ncbi:unnamed protein product, partial [Musa textilis]
VELLTIYKPFCYLSIVREPATGTRLNLEMRHYSQDRWIAVAAGGQRTRGSRRSSSSSRR